MSQIECIDFDPTIVLDLEAEELFTERDDVAANVAGCVAVELAVRRQEHEVIEAQIETNTELLQRAQAGDMEAYAVLFSRHRPGMIGAVKGDVRGSVEDIIQETFIRTCGKVGGFEDRGRGIGGWLVRIATNISYDHHRRQSRHDVVPLDESAVRTLPASDNTEQSALGSIALQDVLTHLSPMHSELIRSIFVMGEPESAYAARMGITITTVRTRLLRARKHLESLRSEGIIAV